MLNNVTMISQAMEEKCAILTLLVRDYLGQANLVF